MHGGELQLSGAPLVLSEGVDGEILVEVVTRAALAAEPMTIAAAPASARVNLFIPISP